MARSRKDSYFDLCFCDNDYRSFFTKCIIYTIMSFVLVISGPAGVGKTTICNQLLKDFKNTLSRVVTSTTRIPRSEEIDGVDYHFLKEKSFVEKLNNGEFLEHEIIHGNYYGTQKESVYSILKTNRAVSYTHLRAHET